jgi:aerotaxis receptor
VIPFFLELPSMRMNQPISDREIDFPADEPLVSRTDASGRITFVNHAFLAVSGFTKEELIGAPHSMVHHPHMPKETFADFRATLKAGRPCKGLVKNRTKAGDFYWVHANATPVVEDGKVTGYISIWDKPSKVHVAKTEAAYAKLLAGTAERIGLRGRQITRHEPLASLADAWASLIGGSRKAAC